MTRPKRPCVRAPVQRASLTALRPSARGALGTRCPDCRALLSFQVQADRVIETCPHHGAVFTPQERRGRWAHLYDQRPRFERALRAEVRIECRPADPGVPQRYTPHRQIAVGAKVWGRTVDAAPGDR